jgi:hypothetical protein
MMVNGAQRLISSPWRSNVFAVPYEINPTGSGLRKSFAKPASNRCTRRFPVVVHQRGASLQRQHIIALLKTKKNALPRVIGSWRSAP